MNNKAIKMLKIYQPTSNLDWMNYTLKKEDITLHHIIKKCDKGKNEISNLALLMPTSHQYLHIIENIDIKTYIALNKIFKIINEQQTEPTLMQRDIIENILLMFEEDHKNDRNKNGKIIIKSKYKERWVKYNP